MGFVQTQISMVLGSKRKWMKQAMYKLKGDNGKCVKSKCISCIKHIQSNLCQYNPEGMQTQFCQVIWYNKERPQLLNNV